MDAFAARVMKELARLGYDSGPLVVGVSGGVDSVVLAWTLDALGVEIVVAHVDHGLRPESAEDAAWVAALADEIGVPSEVLRVEVADGNVQAQAREARYRALGALAERIGSRSVAVAHTATDQAETLLLNLTRGAGLRGLAGMPPARPLANTDVTLLRPLLWASREEVEAVAQRNGWAWREDPTNETDRYLRNRIRHHVLPLLEAEGGPGTVRRMARSARIVRSALDTFGPGRVFDARAVADEGGGRVPLDAGVTDMGAIRRGVWARALQVWAPDAPLRYEVVTAIDDLVGRPVGAQVVLPGLVVWRERAAIRFETSPREPVEEVSAPLAESGVLLVTEAGTLALDPVAEPDEFSPDPNEEHVDADALGNAVTLRPWRSGDRFHPLGLDGSKLVSDLLTDRRVPPSERECQLVLCGADGRIVWVVGHRLSEHAAITDATTRRARIRWTPASIAEGEEAG